MPKKSRILSNNLTLLKGAVEMRKTYNNLRGAGKSMVSSGANMIQRKKYNQVHHLH